ncbi:MAG: divergent polysaccharide deacetylase family protein [Alphaproteobacteria bacterium]|nr:divergent polysaccharide deacetylase family protein [Alphaproteobacteria bacterium]
MSQEDSPDAPKYGPKYGRSALAITSVLLLAAAAGVIGWLALGGEEYQDRFGHRIPVVILPLPSAESPAAETGAPAQPVEPGPSLVAGGGAEEDASKPAKRAETSPPTGPKEAAGAVTKGAAPEAPPKAPPKAPKVDTSEKSLAEVPVRKPRTPAAKAKTPAAKATPPEKARAPVKVGAPVKVEAPVKAEVQTAPPEPPAKAKAPSKPAATEPKANAKAKSKASPTVETPVKAEVETATPEPPASVEPPAPETPEPAKKDASKASRGKTAVGETAVGETVVRLRPSTIAPKTSSPVSGPPKTLSDIITRRSALKPAPDPGLTEKSGLGLLPVIGDDGRKPWLVYARRFDERDRRPRIALVIVGLGLSEASTQAAIQRLPGAVTLAFAPYAKTLDRWIPLARAAGHEVLLTLPMEPDNFPADDPGPHTLLTSLAPAENLKRLRWVLSRTSGYVGVINDMGARFTTSSRHLDPVLGELKRRGLMFVDSGASLRSVAARMATRIGLARAINNRFIDVKASREAIDQRLSEIERIARTSGHALGVGTPYPVTFERVGRWLRGFEKKGLVLVPVSALANKQPD